ncbi:hypothetical protein NS506_06179 [Nocardia seriolae]|uniref:Uncharacterized protein n=1 Tax=Nocardia seriolae TaxID=37332 RepID=A0ABC8B0Y4_9NOCA|nr:hypothetical protein NS506_06179 [Nocardia seriolae]
MLPGRLLLILAWGVPRLGRHPAWGGNYKSFYLSWQAAESSLAALTIEHA